MEINQKVNSLTLIEMSAPKIRKNGAKRPMGVFKCDCGNESIKSIDSVLKKDGIRSCWTCSHKRSALQRATHSLCKHPLYAKWNDMKNRCYNPGVDRYPCYGGRGIEVCAEWRFDFKKFYDWCMDNKWVKGLSIDRIDVNGNYEPINCRMVRLDEQHYNKRNTIYIEYAGKKYSLSKLLNDNLMAKRYRTFWEILRDGGKVENHKLFKKIDFDKYSIDPLPGP